MPEKRKRQTTRPLQILEDSIEAACYSRTKRHAETAYHQIALAIVRAFVGTDGDWPGLSELNLYLLVTDYVVSAHDMDWLMSVRVDGMLYALTPDTWTASQREGKKTVLAYRHTVAGGYPKPEPVQSANPYYGCDECSLACSAVCTDCQFAPCQAELDSRDRHWCMNDRRVVQYVVLRCSDRLLTVQGADKSDDSRPPLTFTVRDLQKGVTAPSPPLHPIWMHKSTGSVWLTSLATKGTNLESVQWTINQLDTCIDP